MKKFKNALVLLSVLIFVAFMGAKTAYAAVLASQPDSSNTFFECFTPSGTGCSEYSAHGYQEFIPNAGTLDTFQFHGNASTDAFFSVTLQNLTTNEQARYFSLNNYVPGKTDGTGSMELYTLHASDFSNSITFNGTDTWYVFIFAYNKSQFCYSAHLDSCYLPSENLGNASFQQYFVINDAATVISHNPVLIIPGVLGTEIFSGTEKLWLDLGHNLTDLGDQFMDPLQFDNSLQPSNNGLSVGNVIEKETFNLSGNQITGFDYSSTLIEEFQNQGYIKDTDLFLFPYDWRYGVNNNLVEQLKQKILDIKTQTGSNKIDVIAHSNGGLLVKKYVTENLNDNYIDKAIFVGVPNMGAPKAIKVLLQGDSFGIPWLADGEMKKIAKNLPALYDLAPTQEYYNQKGSYVKIINEGAVSNVQDLDFNQVNNFLTTDHQLNSQGIAEANNLHTDNFDNFDLRTAGVDLYSINGCRTGTIGKIVERRNTSTVPYGIQYNQPEETSGDGTVPFESSTSLPVDLLHKFYALKGQHGQMLSYNGIRQQIVNIISGSNLNVDSSIITQIVAECALNGDLISVYSPLDIEVIDQNGNHSGKASDGSIVNEIPNSDFEVMGEHKFVYIPKDNQQTYTISLKGTGSGTFTLTHTNIVNNQTTDVETYKDIPVTTSLKGSLDIKNSTKLILDTNGDNTPDIQLIGIPNGEVIYDTTPPELKITFDINTKDVVLSAQDNIDPHPTTTISTTSITLKDANDNTTIIPFTKLREIPTRLRLSYNKITRNSVTTTVPNTNIIYDWQEKKGLLTDLDTKVTIKGEEKYVFNYKKVTNNTVVKTKVGKTATTITKPGFVAVTVLTNGDDLNVTY